MRADGPAQVYRCFDSDGVLLYVGATTNLTNRMAGHFAKSAWAANVARIETTDHGSLAAALFVEAETIYSLRPRWNIHGRGRRFAWGLVDYVEVMLASAAYCSPDRKPTDAVAKIERLAKEVRRRWPDVADVVLADVLPFCEVAA